MIFLGLILVYRRVVTLLTISLTSLNFLIIASNEHFGWHGEHMTGFWMCISDSTTMRRVYLLIFANPKGNI